jgi:hypothetical protein
MKTNFILSIFIGIAAILHTSCHKNPIIGNWKCSDAKITLTSKGNKEYNSVPDSLKPKYNEGLKQLETAMKGGILSLNENGKYIGDVVEPYDLTKNKFTGNWTLSLNKKKLTLKNFHQGLEDYTFKIIELFEDTMIYESYHKRFICHFTSTKKELIEKQQEECNFGKKGGFRGRVILYEKDTIIGINDVLVEYKELGTDYILSTTTDSQGYFNFQNITYGQANTIKLEKEDYKNMRYKGMVICESSNDWIIIIDKK